MELSRICAGNDFDIRITIVQPQYTVEGTIWEDFDLTVCSNIKVALVCEKHRVVIPLNWHIEENTNNIIIANVIAKQLHIGTIYGVEVTGLDANGRAWRFKNADVFSVVDQTKNSLMNAEIMSDPLEINADIGLAINVTPIPVTGPQGPMGMQGPEGERGHIGPQGYQGTEGPVGPQGDIGEKGIGVTSVGYIGGEGRMKHYGMNYGDGEFFDWWVEDGVEGQPGPQGPAGQDGTVSFDDLTPEQRESLRGPQGVQGPQGETGATGPQGEVGATGPQGAPLTFDDLTPEQKDQLRGEDGPIGPQGDKGDKGAKGDKGDKGEQGSIGLTGPQGERGPQGETGATGPQGADGTVTFEELTPEQKEELRGPVGPQGNQGEVGPQGPQGDKGQDGTVSFDDLTPEQRESLRGPQGAQGSIGNAFVYSDFTPEQLAALTGPQGNQGAQGSIGNAFVYSDFTPEQLAALTGPQGNQGAAGQDGQAGVQGPQGNQGDQGPQGADGNVSFDSLTPAQKAELKGDTGPQGPQGDTGATGPQGNQGDTGATGPQGNQGDTGATGPQGPQGDTGATGPQGPQGEQGPQGAGIDSLDKYAIDTIYDEPNSRLYIYLRTASPDGTIYQPNTLTLSYPNQYADIRTNKNLFYSVYINGTSVNTNTFNNAVQKTGRDTYLSLPATIGNITVDKNSIIQFRICRQNPFNSDPHDIINVVLDSKYNVIGNTLGLKIEVVSTMPASPDANTLYVVI